MRPVQEVLRVSANSDPVALGDLRRNVRNAMIGAGLRAEAVKEMEVAVGEVLSNVHRHAYDGDVGTVSVTVFRHSYAVSVLIIDGGNATEAPEVPRWLPPPTRKGGRGLYLVGCFADDVRIRVNKTGYGLTVRLAKRLRSA